VIGNKPAAKGRASSSKAKSTVKESTSKSYGWMVKDGETTHVIVPVEDYEKMLLAEMAQEAIAQIETSRDEDYVDADQFALELAAEKITAARKAAGLTQKALGKKLGIPQSQISRIERNPDHTTVRTLKRIAKALKVDVRVLL
jgi:ribosome-binding protein aMBF1 (putative translation factor)